MAFDIDKMKADGVSSHLIELAELSERNDTAAFEKIAMGIENTEIFRQFISMEADAPVWDYMYAAGMCTKEEADWFKNEENQYRPQGYTIQWRGTLHDGTPFSQDTTGLNIGDSFEAPYLWGEATVWGFDDGTSISVTQNQTVTATLTQQMVDAIEGYILQPQIEIGQ